MTSPLHTRITEAMKSAMRAKEQLRLDTIRMLLAAIKQKEVDERVTLEESQIVALVDKLIKQRKDSIQAYESAQRLDLAAKEQAEITVLQDFLPERLSAKQVQAAVAELVATLQAQHPNQTLTSADMGKVMAAAKAALQGQAEMGQISLAVKTLLNG